MTHAVPQLASTSEKTERPWYGALGQARPVLLPIATAAGILLAWEMITRHFGVLEVILPSPSAIGGMLERGLPLILTHAVPTAKEAIAAFVTACFVGGALAIGISYSQVLRECVYPNLVALQFVPKVALAPLFIIWFGLGFESRLIFAVFVAFFPVMISTSAGLAQTPPEFVRLGRVLTATKRRIFLSIRFPMALPYMFSGMKVAATMSMIGVIVGEFITAKEGLGYLILFASSKAETTLIFAALVALCTIGLAIFGALTIVEKTVRHIYRAS